MPDFDFTGLPDEAPEGAVLPLAEEPVEEAAFDFTGLPEEAEPLKSPQRLPSWDKMKSQLPDDSKDNEIKDSLSLAATYDIDPKTALTHNKKFKEQMQQPSLWDQAQGSLKAGMGDVYATLGSSLKLAGMDEAFADVYIDYGERMREAFIPPEDISEFTWRKTLDPEWWATTVTRSVPFTVSLVPAAIIGAYGGTAAAGVAGLGAFGTTVMGSIGAAGLSRPMESMMEGGAAFEEALGQGRSAEEASSIGWKVVKSNMALVGLDAAQFATAFTPLRFGQGIKPSLLRRMAAGTGKLSAVAVSEAGEERYQEYIQMQAMGEEVNFFDMDNPRLNEAQTIGSIFGFGIGGAGSVWNGIKSEVTKEMPEDVQTTFDTAKKEALTEGLSEDDATLKAFDAVSDTPEGKAHVETVMADIQARAEGQVPEVEIAEEVSVEDVFERITQEDLTEAELDEVLEGVAGGREAFEEQVVSAPVAEIKQRLLDTGMDEVEASSNAALFDGFRVLAERAGLSTEEVVARYLPQVTREAAPAIEVTDEERAAIGDNTFLSQRFTTEEQLSNPDLLANAREELSIILQDQKEEQTFSDEEIQQVNEAVGFIDQRAGAIREQPGQEPVAEGEAPRGRIRFAPAGINIELLKDADQSTFVHETGHLYFRVMRDLSSLETATPQLKQDFGTITDWLGVTEEQQGEITREQEEQFARGFEAFLREGKAPTPALQQAFENFKQWLMEVYQSLLDLNVTLNDDIRGVMDRMLADVGVEVAEPAGVRPPPLEKAEFEQAPRYESSDTAIANLDIELDSKLPTFEGSDVIKSQPLRPNQKDRILYRTGKEDVKNVVNETISERGENNIGVTKIYRALYARDFEFGEEGHLSPNPNNPHETQTETPVIATWWVSDPKQAIQIGDAKTLRPESGPVEIVAMDVEALPDEIYLTNITNPDDLDNVWMAIPQHLPEQNISRHDLTAFQEAYRLNYEEVQDEDTIRQGATLPSRELQRVESLDGTGTQRVGEERVAEPAGIPRAVEERPAISPERRGIRREGDADVGRVLEPEILEQEVAPKKPRKVPVKTRVRKVTGQVKPTELKQLRDEYVAVARASREAFKAGKNLGAVKEAQKLKRILARARKIKDVRNYFKLTDAELKSISRKNPLLLSQYEFKLYIDNVRRKAVEIEAKSLQKAILMQTIYEKDLGRVDNYRRALGLPTISKMTIKQLEKFTEALEPFHDGDVFLSERELQTVDRTDLAGIRTWREAKGRLAKEIGVSVEELSKIRVKEWDEYKWDTALAEANPFYKMLVTETSRKLLEAEISFHDIETEVFRLAKASEKSRNRTFVEKAIPQDNQIMEYIETPVDQREEIAETMTPQQLDFAHYIESYFQIALEYLIKTKSLDRGRQNYFVHMRKPFLENVKDAGLIKAFKDIFKSYQEDEATFNIMDEDTGNILPLEKFFQFTLRRTGGIDPTTNVTKAFLTYAQMMEKKISLDELIPKVDIYAQSLTPEIYTPRGLEIDRSLKKFVNKYINNKKGRRIRWIAKQGGTIDVSIRGLRTFTTVVDLGLNIPTGIAAFVGEQVANFQMLGTRGYTKGTARIKTKKGKAILKKYEAFIGRSTWEEFTAPGKLITERISDGLFGLFHEASVLANKQFLLGTITQKEYDSGTITEERLTLLKLEMGRFRVVPGTKSLVGSTSAGSAMIQYKSWAVPIIRTLSKDASTLVNDLAKKPVGEALTTREAREIYRFIGATTTAVIVGAMAASEDDDESFTGQVLKKVYRESMTLLQGVDPSLWLATPRLMGFITQLGKNLKAIITLEEYKTKPGLKGIDGLQRQFIPRAVKQFDSKEVQGR